MGLLNDNTDKSKQKIFFNMTFRFFIVILKHFYFAVLNIYKKKYTILNSGVMFYGRLVDIYTCIMFTDNRNNC